MTVRQSDWVQLAFKFGPGWALAAFLVYFLTATVSTAQTSIKNALDKHVVDMQLDAQRNRFLLEAICRNTAGTEKQLANCDVAAR